MHQRLSLDDIKARKQHDNCPTCGAELEEFMYKEDGEEFTGKKCKAGCGWWGS